MLVLAFDEVDSTMLEADRQAEAGVAGPVLIWARSQTGGQGRHGRAWASPPGNLYWTILLPRTGTWPRDFGLTFAAGLAVVDALQAVGVPGARLQLKWPNDCLLDGSKVAGVLVRASFSGMQPGMQPGTQVGHAVVGIGVNLATFPHGTFYPASSLAAAGFAGIGVERLRDALTASVMRRFAQWQSGGYPGIRPDVEARLHGVGQPVRVALDQDRTVFAEGVSGGLDHDGALRLRHADGTWTTILAGDVLPAL